MTEITKSDYKFVDDSDDSHQFSEILVLADNMWKGIQFKYGKVTVRVIDETEEMAQLSYEFEVMNQEPDVARRLEEDQNLQNYIGDILTHIITNAFEEGDYRIGREDDTDDDTAQSTPQ